MILLYMRTIVFAILAASAVLFGAFNFNSDPTQKEQMILDAVMNFLQKVHFDPQDMDDEFSEKTYDLYVESLDVGKRFLTKQDLSRLSVYRPQIDDQLKAKSFEFFDMSLDVLDAAHTRGERIYNATIKQDFKFDTDETYELNPENRSYAQDESDLQSYWNRMLKYEVLSRYEDALEKNEKADEKKTETELLKESVEDVKDVFDDWFKRINKLRRSDRYEAYLNAVTHMHDPHSDYYNPKEKEDFDIQMGGKLEGIGARLSPDGDYIKVVSVVVGGPAWKGKELEVNDLIMKVTQKGEEPLDITGMRIDDVVQKIRGKKGTVVILNVKKEDGTIVDVEIERDVVIMEEGNAKSSIINMPGEIENIGYIRLPKFYADFESKDGRSSAVHIAQELEKLKANNVNGIILDLRNNGGGSLRDVVQMSGLFFDQGPIVQVKPRGRDAQILSDEDPETRYDGPLIVMVNSFSASASEILAAALQDYNRAVIVGSTSTFGKGTVQRFYDLDRAVRGASDMKPLGSVKITTQKFYRVNGGSTQLKGVTPDVILPNNYHYIKVGEKEYDYALDWTEIEAVEYGQDAYVVKNLETLRRNSKARIGSNENFGMVLENAARFKKNRDETQLPLSFSEYNSLVDSKEEEADKFEDLYENDIENLLIANLDIDMEKINIDSSSMARNDDWIDGLKKDFYLEETMYIMKDLIKNN